MSETHHKTYGFNRAGQPISAPAGWTILAEGTWVPHVHREYISQFEGFEGWNRPRASISTMTPIHARIWGDVRAIAVPVQPAA